MKQFSIGVFSLVFIVFCTGTHSRGIPILTEPACPDGWSQFKSSCYLVSGSIVTNAAAQQFCQQKGGDLVKINNQEENEFVLQLARKKAPSANQIWLGLHFQTGGQTPFYWSDNSKTTFVNWSPHEPNGFQSEPCGQMFIRNDRDFPLQTSGNWNDISCTVTSGDFANAVVCQKLANS